MQNITPATVALAFPEGLARQNYQTTLSALRVKAFTELKAIMKGTVEDCLDHPPMSVLLVKNHTERKDLQAFIEAELIRTNAQMNMAHPMNTPQIIFTAEQLIDKFTTETLADITLVLQRLAMGYYGNTYHKLDCATVVDAMRQHLEEKCYIRERNNTKLKQEERENKVDYKAYAERRKKEMEQAEQKASDERERRRRDAKEYYEHKAKKDDWTRMHAAIYEECRERFRGIHSITGFAIHDVEDHRVFCRSQEEANQIHAAAKARIEAAATTTPTPEP